MLSSVSGELSFDTISLVGKFGKLISVDGEGLLTFKIDLGGDD